MATREVPLGSMTLQPGRQLLADGKPVALGKKSLDILSVLAGAGGELVTKDELMEAVWPGMIVEENAIQAHMVVLRKALGPEADRLKTVRGFGYRLQVPAGAGAARPQHQRDDRETGSVAVLPFANLTGDPALDYLGEGIAEELICTLSRITDLQVPARTSTFAYRGRDGDVREIARELGVATVLEGSVRAAGERIRVTAQLIDAASGFHLWSQNYDRDITDLIAVQDDIAGAIAAALQSRLVAPRRRTSHADAFDLYLRGRSLTDRGSPENLIRAISLFEEAVQRDPDYADARTGLARALVYACSRGALGPEKYRDALEQSRRACDIDPLDAGAHAMYACANARFGNFIVARRSLERAIELHEADADLHCLYSSFLTIVGHTDRAERHARRARELAPASAVTHVACAHALDTQKRTVEAGSCLDAALELGFPEEAPPVPLLQARVTLAKGDHVSAARRMAASWRHVLGERGSEALEPIYGTLTGHASPEAAARQLEMLLHRAQAEHWIAGNTYISAYLLDWAVLSGDAALLYRVTDLMLAAWRETGIVAFQGLAVLWSPDRAHLRHDPHLADFFKRIGIRDYWDAFGDPDSWLKA